MFLFRRKMAGKNIKLQNYTEQRNSKIKLNWT